MAGPGVVSCPAAQRRPQLNQPQSEAGTALGLGAGPVTRCHDLCEA